MVLNCCLDFLREERVSCFCWGSNPGTSCLVTIPTVLLFEATIGGVFQFVNSAIISRRLEKIF